MDDFTALLNIGEEVNSQLHHAGIHDIKTLKKLGSKEAWLKIQKDDPTACIHRLYALEGAIRGVKKKDLSADTKTALKEFYNTHKK